ncbi:MAG TPA: NAD(P)-dependent alcohol dehydrogenase [Terracidiphilus sp.]|jgi:NADPH:quinone reductase-like Zn-dependent oxidoreductase|nr:NAD(P)-dependent alcohol dehydrogenase [Terracidiphilus sp.]
MQAIVYHHYGPPDVLQLQELQTPVPSADQVLLKVSAAAVNPYDWHFLRGAPAVLRIFLGLRKPKTTRLGADVAGVVEAVGSNVTHLKPGDAVFGTATGAFAEYACAAADSLAFKPADITFAQAASLPIAGITALQGLRDKGKLQSGQAVLINGAAGGVGTFAVQIAKSMGARVTGVCSTRNIDLVRSIGADRVLDYTREAFSHAAERYDLLFDFIGNHSLPDCLRVLQPTGTYVSCAGGGPEKKSMEFVGPALEHFIRAPFSRKKMPGLLAKINPADLEHLANLVATGKVTPVIERTYPLRETADAIRHIETGHARGKVVITIP